MSIEIIEAEIRTLSAEADSLTSKKTGFNNVDAKRVDFILSRVSDLRGQLKSAQTTDSERRDRARQVVLQTSGPEGLLSNEEKGSVRSLLLTPRHEERTYRSAMSEGSQSQLVPVGFYQKLTLALKKADALFDDSVTTPLYTDTGAPLSAPFVNDTGTSATVVTENSQSSELEPATISRLSFAKCPQYRTGQMVASIELMQDSAFPIEDAVVVPLAQKRIQRGVGAAGVTALLAGISSGASSGTAGTCKIDDVLALIQSVDPAYLSGSKAFIAMNNTTMLSLMRQTSTTGSLIWKPRYDAAGRPMLGNLPVIICPSLPSVATSAKPVVVGDFGAVIHRQVKSVDVRRYEQNITLAENGMVAFEVVARHDFGVIDANALKYLTIS